MLVFHNHWFSKRI